MAKTPEFDLKEDYKRNFIINGDFDFWQRGTSFASPSNEYTADRWLMQNMQGGGTSEATFARSTDVPTFSESGVQSLYSGFVDVTGTFTPGGGVQSGQYQYRIEGNELRQMLGKKFTLSFWVKATKTGLNAISVRAFSGPTITWTSEYTINQSNTWERKSVIIDFANMPTLPPLDNSLAIAISWSLAVSDTFDTNDFDQWNAAQHLSSSNQVNHYDNVNNEFRMTQVMLSEGSEAPTFQRSGKSIQEELAMCQRYYEKSYDLDVVPGTASNPGRVVNLLGSTVDGGTSDLFATPTFATTKRNTPTVVLYSNLGTINTVHVLTDSGTTVNSAFAGSVGAIGEHGFQADASNAGVTAAGFMFQWTANAEL